MTSTAAPATSATPSATFALSGVAPLPHLGVIKVAGEDAASFLQGQLTQDFALLGLSEARLAAFCSAKGRMQASFIGFKRSHTETGLTQATLGDRSETQGALLKSYETGLTQAALGDRRETQGALRKSYEILLVCSRDILPATLKRLSMFVLRAKAKLSDASDEFQLFGLAGDALAALSQGQTGNAWRKWDMGSANLVQLYPANGQARALWLAPKEQNAPVGAVITPQVWAWSEVQSGIATITQAIVEAFVPQMLNYESVGGVNFKKGCYPGQEVVARSQFRGTLKRRAYLVHSPVQLAAGQEVFSASDSEQPCGLVAQAAPAPSGGWDALVSIQISAAEQGSLRLGAALGPALELQALPYPLLADI